MIKKVFDNYEAFYNMVLSTTIMSNAPSVEYEEDAKKIIEFIGGAYGLDKDFIAYCSDVILGDLARLGRTIDQLAVYSDRAYGDCYTQDDALFDIKGDVLATLQRIGGKEDYNINEGWFDYSHYKTYQAQVRYKKIEITASSGNLIATRQVGLLKALGIGCEKDCERAIWRLTQCAYWGDITAMKYLAYINKQIGNDEQYKLWWEIDQLSEEFLRAGITVIPASHKDIYSEKAQAIYVYVSSIAQDVIHALNKTNIDFSFIEAITSPTLDYHQKIFYINNYSYMGWKEVTNSSAKPKRTIGF
jgi:hypothetical protein